jgi:hypothetical protein
VCVYVSVRGDKPRSKYVFFYDRNELQKNANLKEKEK